MHRSQAQQPGTKVKHCDQPQWPSSAARHRYQTQQTKVKLTSQAQRSSTAIRHRGEAQQPGTKIKFSSQAQRSGTAIRHRGQAQQPGTKMKLSSQVQRSSTAIRHRGLAQHSVTETKCSTSHRGQAQKPTNAGFFQYLCSPRGKELALTLANSDCATDVEIEVGLEREVKYCYELYNIDMTLASWQARKKGKEVSQETKCL
ncbi:hypothetical protein PoB_000034400 [Plakobranchus ocellatus]|uniref:Uncharacterized protein n=1 Tax=Plakobranchus ocellatus TaxID=259542 RepID=A0AAV3XVN6_9GAST|nr:hypothetical protein PoB_000034400 [Plakobranchus ocellatus]